ncbi:MAG: hypothetical protein R6V86_01010 [Spirochaetia bacterium]
MELPNAIRSEIEALTKEMEILSIINLKRKQADLDGIEIRAAALSLSALYNGIEKILLDILKESGYYIKNQKSWHTLLLKESVRHRIISETTFNELKGFLGFRHFIRHAYSFEINPLTINTILDRSEHIAKKFILEIQEFYQTNSDAN